MVEALLTLIRDLIAERGLDAMRDPEDNVLWQAWCADQSRVRALKPLKLTPMELKDLSSWVDPHTSLGKKHFTQHISKFPAQISLSHMVPQVPLHVLPME